MHHFEAMKSSNVHFTFFRMGKILEGLLAGSVEAEVPHGVECLRDAKHIWERFGGVIDQLQHGTFNSVLHAIEDLGHIIHDIANELEECKATTGTDLDKLREMSQAFTDPWYFIFHVEHDLIVNGQDVHHEIMDAQAQWENQHFYEFGHSVGLALSKIFLSGSMKNDIPAHMLPAHHERTYEHGHADTLYEHTRHHADPVVYDHSYHSTGHHYNNDEAVAHHDTTPYEHAHETTHHETVAHHADFIAEPVHHRSHEYVHEEYHHEEPRHYVERIEGHHEYRHDEPRVVHDTPVHHEVPHFEHPHHEEFHQEEPHVEFEHEAHAGPVHHEYTTVVPHHTTHEMSHEHGHYSPELSHSYYGEHETAHHAYRTHEPEHYYTEASHHYYQ